MNANFGPEPAAHAAARRVERPASVVRSVTFSKLGESSWTT